VIAVDWGTTSFRAYRLDAEGRILETRASGDGILSVKDFSAVLKARVGDWKDTPILMSGMVGSRQGWREAAYVECPAGFEEICKKLLHVQNSVWIVPGLICRGGVPDVMRGEETQILGCGVTQGVVCLPGTHSKWVEVAGGKIQRFSTCMTGEVFAVMKAHSILGRMMAGEGDSFLQGVARSGEPGGLLHHFFGVRTRSLVGELFDPASYLSGILIGHELRAAGTRTVSLLGAPQLTALYAKAGEALGIETTVLPAESGVRALFRLGSMLR
jgi:2-dehydro-3-deoxygalactonokinase